MKRFWKEAIELQMGIKVSWKHIGSTTSVSEEIPRYSYRSPPLVAFFGLLKGGGNCRKSGSERRLRRAFSCDVFYLYYLSSNLFDNSTTFLQSYCIFAVIQNGKEESKYFTINWLEKRFQLLEYMTLKTSEVSNSSSNLVNVFERFQNLKKEGGGNCKGASLFCIIKKVYLG